MGFMDNVTSAVNRGTAAAGRSTDKIKINARACGTTVQNTRIAVFQELKNRKIAEISLIKISKIV